MSDAFFAQARLLMVDAGLERFWDDAQRHVRALEIEVTEKAARIVALDHQIVEAIKTLNADRDLHGTLLKRVAALEAENAALRAKVEHYAEICGRCAYHVEAAHQKHQAEIEQREHDAEALAEMEREDG